VLGARRRIRLDAVRPALKQPRNGVHQTMIVRVLLFAVVLAGALVYVLLASDGSRKN
jgi:hypothetical protein